MTRTGMLRRSGAISCTAASGRQRMAISASPKAPIRESRDFRFSSGKEISEMSGRVLEACADLQTRRSNLAVDEHLRSHGSVPCMDDALP